MGESAGTKMPAGADRIGVGVEPGMAVRGRDGHGPVAGAAHVGLAALLDALEGARGALVVMLAGGRADQLAELVVESLGAEVALLLGHPLLQTKVRFDDELAHGVSSRAALREPFYQPASNSTSSAPSTTCSPTA